MSNILSHNPFKKAIIRGVESAEIVEKANEVLVQIFGPGIGEHATAAYYKEECLRIACMSSTVAQEIKLRESQILSEISKLLPGAKITKIAFMI